MQEVKEKALELLRSGKADRVLGWKKGEFFYDLTPAVFESEADAAENFEYGVFSGANLSKYLIAETKKEGKIAVFLKPCDSYSFVQLQKEHRIDREKCYAVGVACEGMCDIDKIKDIAGSVLEITEEGDVLAVRTFGGETRIDRREVLLEKCISCKSRKIAQFDEIIGEQGEETDAPRFAGVEAIEKMSSEERFAFWQGELSRCIRCNACRNVCPACSCEKCVFDNHDSGVENKAAANSFEEQMFHIIRAFHVASRCTDCGECSRVCPQKIPLHLLNRKFIKDINALYGDYQAGADLDTKPPLMDFTMGDIEPSAAVNRREGNA